jgi:hypothetical protein
MSCAGATPQKATTSAIAIGTRCRLAKKGPISVAPFAEKAKVDATCPLKASANIILVIEEYCRRAIAGSDGY